MSTQSAASGSAGRPLGSRLRPSVGFLSSSLKLRIGLGIVALYVLVAIFAGLLAPYGPNSEDLFHPLADPSAQHLLGTDGVGRDVLSRLIYASRIDLSVAVAAVAIPAVIGTAIGLAAGFYGRLLGGLAMRLADLVLAFPVYVLVLAVVAVLGPGAKSIIIASSALGWVIYARLVRGEVLRVKSLDYVLAARAGGLPRRRVLLGHVLPNVIAQPVIYLTSDLVILILALSALTFLGVGIPAPTAEWGAMISDAAPFLRVRPWLIIPPGLAVVVLGVGLSLIADALADRLKG